MCLFLQKKENVVMKNVFIFTEEKCGYEECVYFYRRKMWL